MDRISTGDDYKKSVNDGRASFIDGELVEDVATHPLLAASVEAVAETYDRLTNAGNNPLYTMPQSAAEVRELMALLAVSDPTATGTLSSAAATTVAERLDAPRAERLRSYLVASAADNLRLAPAVEDVGGSLRVVERRTDGVVVKGAKRHVLGAALVHHLLVVPSSKAASGDAEANIAFAMPVNAPGVKVVSISPAPRTPDTRHYPLSRDGNRSCPDGLVIFNNVFIPEASIFVDGDPGQGQLIADAVASWQRARAVATQSEVAELMLGLARTIAEMNGVPDAPHIREELSAMAVWATLCRAGWESAQEHAGPTLDGSFRPDDAFIFATKAYGGELFNEMRLNLFDVAGGLVATAPTVADYYNPDLQEYLNKYLQGVPGVSGFDRMRVFHAIRDVAADTWAGWFKVTNQTLGGGLFEQKLATLGNYDLPRVQTAARIAAGIEDQEPL